MSMRAAINAKCKDCIYDRCAPGTWRQQVQNCTISTCSLWGYRPKATKARGEGNSVQKTADLTPNEAVQ